MYNIVFVVAMAMITPIQSEVVDNVAILPEELEIPKGRTQVKKSKGKGRGNTPYYARYFK